MTRVLIVEDERKVLRSLERGLRAEGFTVTAAADGEQGYAQAMQESFDCIVLDVMLPGRSGLEILADLRKAHNKVPVLLLTARDATEDRVLGLDSGADDYLVKPFAFAELVARLRALIRRGAEQQETMLHAAGLELDLVHRCVIREGQQIPLKTREFELLAYLMRHKNEVVTREMIGREVWQDRLYAMTNVMEVYVNFLRKKLDVAGRPSVIQTVRGVGYRLRDEPCA